MKEVLGVLKNYQHIREQQSLSLKVLSCGYQQILNQNHRVLRTKGRSDFQLILIAKGKGQFDINGIPHTLGPGHLILYKPNVPQLYSYLSADGTLAYWLHFIGESIVEQLDIKSLTTPLIVNLDSYAEAEHLFRTTIGELQMREPDYDIYANNNLNQLLILFKRALISSNQNPNTKASHIQAVMTLMHETYGQKNTLQYYAEYSGLSVSHFISNFKQLTGYAPMKYLTHIRMENALQYLTNPDLSISEIGHIIGFEDPLYFSRVFKKHYNTSPSSYRKKLFAED